MAGSGAAASRVDPALNQQEPIEEDDFQTVSYSRAVKHRIKRKREGSMEVENLSLRSENSSDDDEPTIFSTPTQNRQPEFKVFISPIDRTKSLKSVNPVIIAKQIREVCPNPEFIKPTAKGLIIKCRNQKQVKAILQISIIGTIPVKSTERQTVEKGVIYGVSTEMKENEILHELKHQGVVDVKRIMKRSTSNVKSIDDSEENRPKFIPMTSVILSFNKPILPSSVTMCFQSFTVKQYIPQVKRCFQCQRFGHGIAQCRAKMRCVRCGQNHTFDQCNNNENRTCPNCGGDHSAAFQGCPEAKKAKKIQTIKVKNNVTYAQAAKLLSEQEKPTQPPEVASEPPEPSETPNPRHDAWPLPPQPMRTVRPKITNPAPKQVPQPRNPLPQTQESGNNKSNEEILSRGNLKSNEEPLSRGNILTQMSNEQLISFITQLILTFTEGRTEEEISSLVKSGAERLFQQRVTKRSDDVLG